MALRSPLPTALALLMLVCAAPLTAAAPDEPGPFTVIEEGYDFGFQAWRDPAHDLTIDFTAAVYRPAELGAGPFPLVLIAHGRHSVAYDIETGAVPYYPDWPPKPGEAPLPNHLGYGWLAERLASQGCIVVSVRIAGFGYQDDNLDDGGSEARARLLRAHLAFWRQANSGSVAPFGARLRGAVDLDRIALVGHSRGGTGVVAATRLLQDLGEDAGLRAVLTIAPGNLIRKPLRGVPVGVILGYLDGDVGDLGGVHHYDDARAGDPQPRHLLTLQGGNHNQFNTYWDPDVFAPGASRDGPTPSYAIDGSTQRAVAAAWCTAFLRQYLLDDQRWLPVLAGDLPAPIADIDAQASYYPGVDARLRINSTLTRDQATRGDADGDARATGDLAAATFGGGDPQPDCLVHDDSPPYYTWKTFYKEPHWDYPRTPGLRHLLLRWDGDGSWQQDIPARDADWQGFAHLALRVAIDFTDSINPADTPQDLSLELRDADGTTQRVALSDHGAGALRYPAASGDTWLHPKIMFHQLRVPLTAFDRIDLTAVRSLRLRSDREASGQVSVTDLVLERALAPDWTAQLQLGSHSTSVGSSVDASIVGAPGTARVTWQWGDNAHEDGGTSAAHSWAQPGRYIISAAVQADGTRQLLRQALVVAPSGGNSPPTCTQPADVTIDQASVTSPVSFTIGDADTDADALHVTLSSSDPVLLPRARLQLSRDGSACHIVATPVPTLSGQSTITIAVSDGQATTERSFLVTVDATPAASRVPPTLGVRPEDRYPLRPHWRTWQPAGSDFAAVVVIQQYEDTVDPADITVTVTSSDEALLPAASVVLSRRTSGTYFDCTVPVPDTSGTQVRLTFTSDDGVNQTTATFDLHVLADANEAPAITAPPTALPDNPPLGAPVRLAVDASDADGPLPLSYFWLLRSWPNGFVVDNREWSIAANATPLAATTTVTGLSVPGTYEFAVEVSDGLETVTSQRVAVEVGEATQRCRAYWPLDEARGLRRTRPGNGPVLAAHGRVDWALGYRGLAVACNATDAHLSAVDDGLQTLELREAATWCVAVRPDAIDGTRLILGRHSEADPGWLLELVDGHVVMTCHGAETTCSVADPTPLVAGAWTHLGVVYDGDAGRLTLYRDGSQVAATTADVPPALRTTRAAFTLAGPAGPQRAGLPGRYDELRIYASALSAPAIADLVLSGNRAPLLRWVAPAASYWAGTGNSVSLALNALDPDGDALTITLYRVGMSLDTYHLTQVLAALPAGVRSWRWDDPAPGAHRLYAVAEDGTHRVVSPPLDLWIGSPASAAAPRWRTVRLLRGDGPWAWEHAASRGVPFIDTEADVFRELLPHRDHAFIVIPVWDN